MIRCDTASALGGVSSHYLVNDDVERGWPTIYGLVDEDRRSYHAGASSWKGSTQLNDSSIGIEIVNPGGPFGIVTVANFGQPGVTDYRNPHLAEAMKVLRSRLDTSRESLPLWEFYARLCSADNQVELAQSALETAEKLKNLPGE